MPGPTGAPDAAHGVAADALAEAAGATNAPESTPGDTADCVDRGATGGAVLVGTPAGGDGGRQTAGGRPAGGAPAAGPGADQYRAAQFRPARRLPALHPAAEIPPEVGLPLEALVTVLSVWGFDLLACSDAWVGGV